LVKLDLTALLSCFVINSWDFSFAEVKIFLSKDLYIQIYECNYGEWN